jgi:MraZ protein
MSDPADFLIGEHSRTLDERYRLTLPPEFATGLMQSGVDCILAKERLGCLSLWSSALWQKKFDANVQLVRSKMQAGKFEGRIDEVQTLGRLLSTRHREVQLAARGRLSLPEGFREFLQVSPGEEVLVVGAALCVELWQPAAWFKHLELQMPEFRKLFDRLSS